MSDKVDYFYTVICRVDRARLMPGDDTGQLLGEFNRRLNELVATEKAALQQAVEHMIENAHELKLDTIRRVLGGGG